MSIENFQSKHDFLKTDRLVKKMWKVQNIKVNLAKIAKISNKNSATVSPLECSMASNSDSISKLRNLSSNVSPNCSFLAQIKCHMCQKLSLQLKQEKIDKKLVQEYNATLIQKFNEISKQKEQLTKNIVRIQKNLKQASEAMDPYKNNVVLMQQTLASIKQSIIGQADEKQGAQFERQRQLDEKKKNIDFQINILKRTHQIEQGNNQTKLNRLNLVISMLENKNKELQAEKTELKRSNKVMQGIIQQSTYVIQQRQLFHMASQQLLQVTIQYKRQKKQKEQLTRQVEKLRNKIHMLTSLIGYGVISNIQNNDLHELNVFQKNIQKMNFQQRVSQDICGMQSIKNYKYGQDDIKEIAYEDQPYNCLYQPSFLILFQEQQIKNALQENVTTIIKPQFFLLVRAIYDSKYSQFLLQRHKSNRFIDFAYSFIDVFKMKKKQKRIQLNSKRSQEDNDYLKTNFLLRVFDRKIGYLPQIRTFRQFIIKNAPQDEVFYYLMSRNLIFNGPELNNYISCSDSYNFVTYSRAIQTAHVLLQQYDKGVKTVIFTHLSKKKVVKNKVLLIKSNYVLRLLLQIYRKFKADKIWKLKIVFEQAYKATKNQIIKFIHFKELLQKNFPFLTHSQICEHYRKTIAIMHTQTSTVSFFDAFQATCLEYIFLQQNFDLDQKIKRKSEQIDAKNHGHNVMLQLIPDAVVQLGNQSIYQQYMKFLKMKYINLETKVKMAQFLLKIIELRIYNIAKTQKESQKLNDDLNQFNSKLIDCVNQDIRQRQKFQQALDKASLLIGKQCKKKIYEFYAQFLKDINKQIQLGNKK